jgi:NADH dehydrogenase
VKAAPIGQNLGAETDRAGRVKVNPDLSVPGRPNIFVAGDLAALLQPNGKPVPGVARRRSSRAGMRRPTSPAWSAATPGPLPLPRQGQPGDHRPQQGVAQIGRCGSAAPSPGSPG